MPHSSLKLIPGVNQNQTPALNQAGVSTSNLIRYIPDPQLGGLIQKLGGWTKFHAGQISSIVRALWSWEDANANTFLGVGTESDLSAIYGFPASGSRQIITPQSDVSNPALSVSSTTGSSIIQINDTGSNTTTSDAVFISTPIAVGGLVLSGMYAVYANLGSNSYQIQAVDIFGNPLFASSTVSSTQYQVFATTGASGTGTTVTLTFAGPVTFPIGSTIVVSGVAPSSYNGTFTVTASTSTTVQYSSTAVGAQTTAGTIFSGPMVPYLETTSGSSTVTVVLPNHGYSVGNNFVILIPTTIGGLLLYGNYIVQSVADQNTFTITSTNSASSSASVFLNGGLAQYTYYIGQGQLPTTSGYGVGGYGAGGYGTGISFPPNRTFATTAATGTGTTATLSFNGYYYIPPGSVITVSGVTPSGYNSSSGASLVVTACLPGPSTSTISYASTATGAQTISGTITVINWDNYPTVGTFPTTAVVGNGTTASVTFPGNYYVPLGFYATVSGVTPSSYNGTYLITSSTSGASSTVSFQSSAIGAQTVAGTVTIYNKVTDWSLDNWGSILIASPAGGAIYEWYYLSGQPTAQIIPQAPTNNVGMFVAMPQRQIIAWGSTFNGIIDPLLIRWCDVNNYNSWVGQITNQAGSYRLPRGSKIVGGIQGPQQGLIWTDLALWSMQYISQPYVYSFNEVGSGCGLIARKAMANLNGTVYWMSQSQFFKFGVNGVESISCPVWDVVFQDLDKTNLDKIRAAPNSQFGEISWFYPTIGNNGEISNYIKFNTIIGAWDFGTLSRTAWINQSVLGPPIGAGFPTSTDSGPQYIYQHETSPDADGSPLLANFTTGYFALNEADIKAFVDEIWPDFKWGYYGGSQSANIQITFYANDFPGQTPTVYGPYSITSNTTYFNPRIRARLLAIEISSSDTGSFWRIGNLRYRSQPDGRY